MNNTGKMRILLVENDPYEVNSFRDFVDSTSDISLVKVCDGSAEALTAARDTLPDAVVLDLELDQGDGLDFLFNLRSMNIPLRPYVVVTTNTTSKPTLQSLRDNGADFVFIKSMSDYCPKKVVDFLRRVQKYFIRHEKTGTVVDETIAGSIAREPPVDPESVRTNRLKTRISAELGLIGIKPNVDGKMYLIEAIILQRERENVKKVLTKEIYPRVAEKFNKNKETIERGIRNAITAAWSDMPAETLEKYYAAPVNPGRGKPTNGEFISYYADKFRGEY